MVEQRHKDYKITEWFNEIINISPFFLFTLRFHSIKNSVS
jgi:hypothetical protein